LIQTIQFGDEGQVATRELVERFKAVPGELLRYLKTLDSLDRQYGGLTALPVEDTEELVAAALTEAAHLEDTPDFPDLAIGIALWATRHDVAIRAAEPVANALARRSNEANSKQELAAVFGLMQGLIAHLGPALSADLERSNPERPWRILHINYAITAIRTEDPLLMSYAFDALDSALPGERGGFYAEALALAMNPRVDPAVRDSIEARHRRWSVTP